MQGTGEPIADARQRFEYSKVVMGSRARVVLHAASEQDAAAAAAEAFGVMSRLEAVMSDYRADSEAMRLMRRSPRELHDVSVDLAGVLALSEWVWGLSDGAFDVTLGALTHRWRIARREGVLPSEEERAGLLGRSGMGLLELDEDSGRVRFGRAGMVLDFGGIGKGHAAQCALDHLRLLGHPDSLVEIGGDLVVGEAPPGLDGWTVAIETGLGEGDRETRVLSHAAVATSGDAEQFVEIDGVRYSHLIDPRTGLGLSERIAVTVVLRARYLSWYGFEYQDWPPDRPTRGLLGGCADALASAISVAGARRGREIADAAGEYFEIEAVIVTAGE
ncbi:MAG: FAD:protein FMN transferase [Phycisphaerales bacterium JB040]